MKLLEHGLKVVEMVLEKRLRRIFTVDEMQFDSMPERGAIYSVLHLEKNSVMLEDVMYVFCGPMQRL